MRLKLTYLLVTITIIFYSCEDNEEPQTLPEVSTATPTDITTTSATIGGSIDKTGNTEITQSGVVYSINVAEPTIADNKMEITIDKGNFTGVLTGLTSGTTYHIRAFATNKVGTGYGEVKQFTTSNEAPIVSNVSIDGTVEVNKAVTATYTYSDAESDPEGATTFQWYVADDAAGTGLTAIEGAVEKTFLIQEAQNDKYLRVAVTPVATAGTIAGVTVNSLYVGKVGEATTVTFSYNGDEVTYGIITSSATQRKWLDRNLGAAQAATNVNDFNAFGDLFQWGRLADGHQRIIRESSSSATAVTGITSTTSTEDIPPTDKFIINSGSNGDWRVPQKSELWQGVNGINNPCPTGWRLPTKEEWIAESLTSGAEAYTKLKLTYSGYRDHTTGNVDFTTYGFYWTSTVQDAFTPTLYSWQLFFDATFLDVFDTGVRGDGVACRCIKE